MYQVFLPSPIRDRAIHEKHLTSRLSQHSVGPIHYSTVNHVYGQ